MSSIVLKLGSLVIKTLAKPIAVRFLDHRTVLGSTYIINRTQSRLKPVNMNDSGAFASHLRNLSIVLTCVFDSDSFKIRLQ